MERRRLIAELPAAVGRTFELMEIAEEEIRRAGDEDGLFLLLCPPTPLVRLDERVYRHHCREIVSRVKGGLDTRPATDAEVLAALSGTSLTVPLSSRYAALYEEIFERIFGGLPTGSRTRQPWRGSNSELLAELRQRLRNGQRVVRSARSSLHPG